MVDDKLRSKLSVCIITFNEEDRIEDCLKSVQWADEIIVVDSFSSDRTVEICKLYTDKVYINKWPGFVNQKNYAIDKAGCEWILSLDSDERVPEALADEIRDKIINDDGRYNGFIMPRRSCYMGRMINHGGWYPDYQSRLFRKSSGRIVGIDPHDKVEIDGERKKLKNDLIHFPYRSMVDQLKTIDNYSTIFVDQMIKDGRKLNRLNMFIRPPTRFLETYIWKKGFLDGLPGLINILAASFYVFLKYAKWHERELK